MKPLVLLMLAGTVCAADPKPPPLRKRLAAAMKTVRSFRADFEQEKKLKVFKKPVRSSGVLLFERPDRMRWETRTPFRSLLVVNGAKVAKFEWVDGKRRALKLGRGADALLVAMRRLRAWFTGEFDEKTFSVEVKEKPAIQLILRPKEKALRARIERIEFFPAKDLKSMKRVVIVEAKGDVTTLRFENHKANQPAPKKTFSVTDPAKLDG
ncbi:MAG: outer membrane lipoprotein carrier protein LolA [Planctomycetota bacterium]|jgi:outer membrane lipoprotein carrier protein